VTATKKRVDSADFTDKWAEERLAERRDWLASTLSDHISRTDWLIGVAKDSHAASQVAESLEASRESIKRAFDWLVNQ